MPQYVMAGLVPAIHAPLPHPVDVDARNKSGQVGRNQFTGAQHPIPFANPFSLRFSIAQ